jgi:hypothetical protein
LHNDHFKRGSFLDEKPSEKLLPLRMQMFGNLNVTLLFHLSLSPSLPLSLFLSLQTRLSTNADFLFDFLFFKTTFSPPILKVIKQDVCVAQTTIYTSIFVQRFISQYF